VIQGFIYLTVLIASIRCFGYYGNRQWFGVFALYLLIYTIRDVTGSHTSGHTSFDAWQTWWMYGVLFSLYVQMLREKTDLRGKKPDQGLGPSQTMDNNR
jgi:hypothetical protein